jgi:hypothetical protein
MSSSPDRHGLFRGSDTSDKLNLLQSLLDSKDLTVDQANALLHVIRVELERPGEGGAPLYRRYAEVMESLHKQMPEVYDQVVRAWQQKRQDSLSVAKPLVQEPAQAGSEAVRGTTLEEMVEEPSGDVERHAEGGHETAAQAEPQEQSEELREMEEVHAEPEEEQEQEKEESEKEEDLKVEPEEEVEKGDEEGGEKVEEKSEGDEEENREEGNRGGDLEEKDEEDGEEPNVEKEGVEEDPEAEIEAEPENVVPEEVEPEAVEESEAEESPESSTAETPEEPEAEGDQMATEAAEADELSERTEAETGEPELPEVEGEPPVEGAE